ncbi:MAG: membrane protein insertion efficiency factor YidD [Deltaproteobacteria bacterium]|nr:MAG: membrane protein insertion efficiency factor YidD [Deltaproteobacteria bacterium]
MNGPWDSTGRHPVTAEVRLVGNDIHSESGTTSAPSPFSLIAIFWSELLTKIDGPRCAHRPTCSAYATESIRRHGPFPGLFMALSRILRGPYSSPLRRLPLCRGKFCDPPSEAEFWREGYLPMSGFR